MKADLAQHLESTYDRNAVLLAVLQPLLAHRKFDTAAAEFLSKLALSLHCERATLGIVAGRAIKLCAMSNHLQKIEPHALPDVIDAMEESLLQDTALLYPQPASEFPHIVVAHAKLVRSNGLASALTVPLASEGRLIGAIALESRHLASFGPDQLWIMDQLATTVGSLIEHQHAQTRPWWTRGLGAVRRRLAGQKQKPAYLLRATAALLSAAAALLLFAVPLPTHITAQARLEALTQRVISAPIDGYLKEVRVRPGDRVQAGQLLAELNDETLITEQRRLEAEIAQQQNALADAMVKADRTQVVIRSAKLDEIKAQSALIDQQLKHTKIVAPFDGIVIKGDLTQLLGTPIKRSDVLVTLSEGPDFRVVLEIDERDILEVEPSQTGTLILSALPADHFDIRVRRVTPIANVTASGQNAFEVESTVDARTVRLTPGLKGTAKVVTGTQPIGWRWAKRLWHALAYAVWSRSA